MAVLSSVTLAKDGRGLVFVTLTNRRSGSRSPTWVSLSQRPPRRYRFLEDLPFPIARVLVLHLCGGTVTQGKQKLGRHVVMQYHLRDRPTRSL
jgi:hypothetical protein